MDQLDRKRQLPFLRVSVHLMPLHGMELQLIPHVVVMEPARNAESKSPMAMLNLQSWIFAHLPKVKLKMAGVWLV
jgi:hypothetical protein